MPGAVVASLEFMTVTARPTFAFDNTYVRDLEGLYEPWTPSEVPEPAMVVLNDDLAVELGLDLEALRGAEGVDVFAGNTVPEGAEPVAQAYAGHQFGAYSPRLGDGRAVLLGEVIDVAGGRRDLHMKGSGRTPFARGGDGKAVLGPMLREYVVGEVMHGLGIPTTRALAVVTTGERIARETMLPGAVLTRVASSHLRVGTFEYAARHPANRDGNSLVRRLADHAIARHVPEAAEAEDPYLELFRGVVEAQAALVARWMLVGFVHGVMNTDNTTISGETIDYGPCAFMDAYDPATVFSSIDHGGRYAFGNQPAIVQWDLARLAETMLPLFDEDHDVAVAAATEVLSSFAGRFGDHHGRGMRAKVGLSEHRDGDDDLLEDLLGLLHAQRVDFTSFFRALSASLRGDDHRVRALFSEPEGFDAWAERWRSRLGTEDRDPASTADAMDAVNPVYIARNHKVEEALSAAGDGDLGPFHRLVAAVSRPFEERPGLDAYAEPAPPGFGRYVTYCGT